MIVIEENTDISSTIIKVLTPFRCHALTRAGRILKFRVPETDIEPLEIVLQYGVDHTSYGISAINRRCAIAEHFNSIDTPHREVVGVGGVNWDKATTHLFRLVSGRVHHSTAVQQHECITRTEVT